MMISIYLNRGLEIRRFGPHGNIDTELSGTEQLTTEDRKLWFESTR